MRTQLHLGRRVGPLAAGFLLLAGATVSAQSAPAISGARIQADMQVLASDSFGGRKPGTPSEQTTTDFIIKQFAGAGLAPLMGNEWLQPVKLVTRRMLSSRLAISDSGGKQIDLGDAVALVGNEASVRLGPVPLMWGGYVRTLVPMNAFAGALVLYRDSDPPGTPQPQPTDWESRLAALLRGGARGALAIIPDDAFARRKAAFEGGLTTLASDPTPAVLGIISESAAKRLLAAAGVELAELEARAVERDFWGMPIPLDADVTIRTEVIDFTSHNVAGMLKGWRQPDEYVMYTAHWDSFGHCRPGEADEICNGAIDNASGTAGMIELARAFASGKRPERSILFLATTAEEMGLAGSRQYARTPLVPLSKTVIEFNLDVIVLYDRGNSAGFVGSGLTNADSVFERLVTAQGRTLDTGQLTRMVVRSSDMWSLLMAGVPSFILSGAIGTGAEGSKPFHEYLATRYHGPGDEFLASMPMGGAVEEVELLYAAGMYYAEAGTSVKFQPKSPFQGNGYR